MIIDGKQIAGGIYARLPQKALKLGILIGEEHNPAIESFVRIKVKAAEKLGVILERLQMHDGTETKDFVEALHGLSKRTDGVIVQLPLPPHIDTEAVLAAIPPEKDVDGISQNPKVYPPVAEAIREILEHEKVNVVGMFAVVVGAGRLVGKPATRLLAELGARVETVGRHDSLDTLKEADIIVLGVGEVGLVRPEHLKPGVILIDAGTSEVGGKVKGDADPACAEIASVFTPVPGGVGPIAVAMIFKNLYELAGQSR